MGLTSSSANPKSRVGPGSPVSEAPETPRHHRTWSSYVGLTQKRPESPSSFKPLVAQGSAGKTLSRTPSSRKLEQVKVSILEDSNVLKDGQWCAAFVRYLKEGYQADLLEGSSDEPNALKRAIKLRATAQVFFDFWADLTDLESCHAPSDFHSLRLEAIVDRYLSRGAETPVPLSELVRSNLLGDDGAGKPSQDSLSEARDEAFRYLSSEVLPLFVGSKSPLGLSACLNSTKRVIWTLEEAARKVNSYHDIMNILVRVASSQAFHSFMQTKDEELGSIVAAAIEILGYKSIADVWALQRWRQKSRTSRLAGHNKSENDSCTEKALADQLALQSRLEITTAHDIFDSHLRLGQTVRRILPPFVIPQLLSAASDTEARKADGGLPVTLLDEVLCYLLNHLRGYLPEYNQTVGAAASFQLFSDHPAEVSIEELKRQREELRILLGASSLKSAFESYLTNHKDPQGIWMFRFHEAVEELHACNTEVPLAVFSKVVKIFLTHVKRGAPCELALMGGAPRIRVVEKLTHPSDMTVYDAAQGMAFDALATQWLPGFVPAEWPVEIVQKVPVVQRVTPPQGVRLSAILDSSRALPALRHFATTEYSDYPLHFWLEAESYRTLPRADLLLARGRAIAEKYIAPEAIRSVPLSEPVRDRILASCDSALVGPGLFIEAQTQVYEWMETELLPKFAQSPAYQELVAQVKNRGRTSSVLDRISRASSSDLMSRSLPIGAEASSVMKMRGVGHQLAPRASNDLASPTAPEPSLEDVLAELNQREGVGHMKRMAQILEVGTSRQYFEAYCKERGAYKHVAFWLDAEDFCKHLPGNDAFRKSQARKLVNKYIADDAVMKVILQGSTLQELLGRLDAPARTAFEQAQEEVLSYMANDLLPGFLESPQLKIMIEANALLNGTPWSRMSHRLTGMFKKSASERLSSHASDALGSLRRAGSRDSLFERTSSLLADSPALSTRDLGRSSNRSQGSNSSSRLVLDPLPPDSNLKREGLHRKALSDSKLDVTGQHASARLSSLAGSFRSRASDAMSTSFMERISNLGVRPSNVERESWVPSSSDDADTSMKEKGEGTSKGTPGGNSSQVQSPLSPRWPSPIRIHPGMLPSTCEGSSEGSKSGTGSV